MYRYIICILLFSVSDSYSFFLGPDPDPEVEAGDGFNDQKLKKITAEKKLNFFLIKNCNLPIPRPP
jgi:hypothetical protein